MHARWTVFRPREEHFSVDMAGAQRSKISPFPERAILRSEFCLGLKMHRKDTWGKRWFSNAVA